MAKKNKLLVFWLILFIIGLLASTLTYSNSHKSYVGQLAYKTCQGVVIPVDQSEKVNGGGPCISGQAFVAHNQTAPFYVSLLVVFISGVGIIVTPRAQKRHK